MTNPKARPLAKALHTVTIVARVAREMHGYRCSEAPTDCTLSALQVLGYGLDQIDQTGDLFAACVKAVNA